MESSILTTAMSGLRSRVCRMGSPSPYKLGDADLNGIVDGTDFGLWNVGKFSTSLAWDRRRL